MKKLLILLIFTMPVFAADDKDKWETIKQDQMMCLFQSQIIYDVQSIRNQVPDDGYAELVARVDNVFGESTGKAEWLRMAKKLYDSKIPADYSAMLVFEGVLNNCLLNAAVPRLES